MLKELIKKEGSKQFIKFCLVGILNTLINLIIFFILTNIFHIYYLISAVFAFLAAVTNSFILNKTWTFKEKISQNTYNKYAKFFLVSIIALVINLLILYVLVEFFNVYNMFAQLIGIASNILINFFGNKLWTFKNKQDS